MYNEIRKNKAVSSEINVISRKEYTFMSCGVVPYFSHHKNLESI